jgi:O-antigen/teichoic acid export membrane protein
LVLLLNTLSGAILARELLPAGRGQFAAITVAPPLIVYLMSMGCGSAVTYHHARFPRSGGTLIATWALILVPLSVIALIAGEVYARTIAAAYGTPIATIASFYALTIVLGSYGNLVSSVCVGAGDYGFYNAIRIAQPALQVAIFLALGITGTLSVASATGSYAGVQALVLAAWLARALRRFGIRRPSLSLARSSFVYGLKSHGATVGSTVNLRLDQFILPLVVGASSLGLYAVAVSANSVVISISSALAVVVLPTAARHPERAVAIARRALAVTLLSAILLAAALALVAPLALYVVYGAHYGGGANALRLLLPGSVALAAAMVVGQTLLAVNRPLEWTFTQLAAAVLTVGGLSLVAVLHAGIAGAAVVSSIAYTATLGVALWFFLRATRLRFPAFILGHTLGVAGDAHDGPPGEADTEPRGE